MPELTFPARLALVRNRMGWNGKEAALACGLPPQSWRNWESGKRPHDYEQVCRAIAARTGCSLMWLLTGATDPTGGGMNPRYEGESMEIAGDPFVPDEPLALTA